jgi:hypothetical protein
VLVAVLQGLVDGLDVLVAAHLSNPGFGWNVDWLVLKIKTCRVPSLPYFRIDIPSDVVDTINCLHYGDVHFWTCLERVLKHDL